MTACPTASWAWPVSWILLGLLWSRWAQLYARPLPQSIKDPQAARRIRPCRCSSNQEPEENEIHPSRPAVPVDRAHLDGRICSRACAGTNGAGCHRRDRQPGALPAARFPGPVEAVSSLLSVQIGVIIYLTQTELSGILEACQGKPTESALA